MLQIQHISKRYVTGDLVQDALKDVSLDFRDNEFVAILGPSGSGKTTLLNIIGGLDRYDSGDLIINNISTKQYKDRDWDSYRNHTIGFVFQSYNLIPHQTVLANVELALTISGISKTERREKAKKALDEVGLTDHINKKPSQLSGGQMQRVAIARALVNNPDILLADEPTGALDTDTGIQVMELLKKVAEDRLVIMVTHNPELAEAYATRIVNLRDGQILNDTDPPKPSEAESAPAEHKNMGRSSMSFRTALALSFNNLRTKKARTILTAFAGSIGIIGIALILSLSNGVNTYITDLQRETMTAYPISISAKTIDLSSVMGDSGQQYDMKGEKKADHKLDGIYSDSRTLEISSELKNSVTTNNLTAFKKYLDDPSSAIAQYIGDNGVVYSYDTGFKVFAKNSDDKIIDTGENAFTNRKNSGSQQSGGIRSAFASMMPSGSGDTFQELIPGKGDQLISPAISDSYEVVVGNWPQAADQVVIVMDRANEIPTSALYALGFLSNAEYDEIKDALDTEEDKPTVKSYSRSYNDIIGKTFSMVSNCDLYEKDGDSGFYVQKDLDNKDTLNALYDNGRVLTVCGIIRPIEDAANASLTGAVAYTGALTRELIAYAEQSAVVQDQMASPEINIQNGTHFKAADDATKIEDVKNYMSHLSISDKATLCRRLAASSGSDTSMMAAMSEAMQAQMLDQIIAAADDDSLLEMYDSLISATTYDDNMAEFGYVSLDSPSGISIYCDSFEAKDGVADCIDQYNQTVSEDDQITYTDLVALMTSSITTIIDVISYVLIAFVAVSLVVSSIMIGIITYISVLERTKEIGILRAIGASKSNISQVFNAETIIIGLISGVLGIGISLLLLIPINAIIHAVSGIQEVNAILPMAGAFILIALSVLLTLIGGLIPAGKAAKKDPVTALRTE